MNSKEADLLKEFEGARFLLVPGHYDVFGGAERQATILGESLKTKYQCHVDFLAWGGNGKLADEVRGIGCTPWVFELNQNQRGAAWIRSLYGLTRFIRNQIRPTYILPFVGIHCKIVGMIWRYTGAKFCWWNQRDEGREIYGTRVEQRLIKTLPAIVSNSEAGRDFLVQKFRIPSERVRIISNGIRTPKPRDRREWRARLAVGDDTLVIAMLANQTKYKDHETLLKAFANVRASPIGSRCHLVLAGRYGETTQYLKALAFDLNLSNCVSMPGNIEDTDGLLATADVVAHSSKFEGCPNAVLEAMAHGRAIVGTDIPGLREALGAKVAQRHLVAPLDSTGLSDTLLELLNDPELRREVGLANRTRVHSAFGIDRMTNEVLETILTSRIAG